MGLGISIYPLISSKEDTINYIRSANTLGFDRIFTSILELSKEKNLALNQMECYKEVLNYAKALGMRVFIDINPQVLKNIDIDPTNLEFFVDLGATGIRLDGIFNGIHEAIMTYNRFNLEVEVNASFNTSYINNIIDFGCKRGNLVACHNFYPQQYTGL
ncbi:MupG family TIM beta-alpha barrel fold protein [Clostridium sp. LP20]|uniref:MupG family TIM beta-alpha barrel fold protein n=1 Tax=Clostridium sp. LP20 TaxID=3418665 RepID=UPI003EE80852